ncbi:putative bifunctional diguanylate cyclase/phosphodiesterase [Halioxenophilus sp. WMMB6]|uniref:putative bifunctional diguanylate cyclase/phosphodiesterase n=1 Tax=Halioxenophilus sp. WMMB6 TaxID=3073815 RepID=UPI00295E961C|nr:EAL domain-containing protein [Halioxenophilus sp. WMMB6]
MVSFINNSSDYREKLGEVYTDLAQMGLTHQGTLHAALNRTTEICARALDAYRASIWLCDDRGDLFCHTLYSSSLPSKPSQYSLPPLTDYWSELAKFRVITTAGAGIEAISNAPAIGVDCAAGIHSLIDAAIGTKQEFRGILRLEIAEENRVWAEFERRFLTAVADLLAQQITLNQLKNNEAKYKALFEGASDAIFVMQNGLFSECNPAALTMFGATRPQMIGQPPEAFSPPLQPDGECSSTKAQRMINACLAGKPQIFEWRHQRYDGVPFEAEVNLNWMHLDGNIAVVAIVRDISKRKQAEQNLLATQRQLEYRAGHDSLTGLPNRDYLHNYIGKLIKIADSQSPTLHFALLLFDLNRFKEVNDTLGHATGDRVLQQIAELLQTGLKPFGGRLFRLGGDEFVVVVTDHHYHEPFALLPGHLNQILRTPIRIDEIKLEMSASIGVALYPEHGNNSHELLRCADVAMYHAKANEGASSLYDLCNDLHSKRRLAMIVELGTAIREDQLLLHFQPRIDINSGKVTGCEALVRWQHPSLGLIPPGEFLPLAEMSDLIHPLGAWVVKQALKHIKAWQAMGFNLPVAINLSARNLSDIALADQIATLLKEYTILPHLLEIEITESALIHHPQRAIDNLTRLAKLGTPLAIDDFGTGYSSLSYLKKLPISTLKIDRSFVSDMLADDSDAVIVEAVITLAHNFSLTVVAEGVETQPTMVALQLLKCDEAQGFHIARPMPAAEFTEWLQNH